MALDLKDRPDDIYDEPSPWETNVPGAKELEDQFNAPSATNANLPDGHPSKKSHSPGNLANMEGKGDDASPSGAEKSEKASLPGGGLKGLATTIAASRTAPLAWIGANKKKAAAGGGIIGSILGFAIGSLIITSGPLQLIHASQLLTGFHWGDNEETSDDRSSKLFLYARNKLNGKSYRNNLGITGNALADKYDARLKEQGIEFERDNSSRAQRVLIDADTDAGRKLEAKLKLEGIEPNVAADGRLEVDLTGDGGAKRIKLLSSESLGAINKNGKASTMSVRLLSKRNGASWNVLKNKAWDKGQEKTKADYDKKQKEERAKQRKEGATDVDPDKPVAGDQDADGDGVGDGDGPDANAARAADDAGDLVDEISEIDTSTIDGQADLDATKRSLTQRLNPAGRAAGSVLAVVGLTCAARDIGEGAEQVQYANNIAPMIRIGTEIISIGSQIQSGKSVNIDEVGSVVNDFFDEAAEPEAKSFFNAKSIQAENGNPNTNGPDLPEEANPGLQQGKPAFFEVLDKIPGAEQTCGVFQTVSNAPGIKQFGEATSALTDAGLEAVVGMKTEDFVGMLLNYLAGNAVNVLAEGAELGNLANTGAFLAGNEHALSMGGRELTDAEVAELREYNLEQQRNENGNKSLFARMFDLQDAQSLASKNLIQNPNIASISASTQSLVQAPSSILSNLGSILSPRVAAAPKYDYGVPKYGFSRSEITNPKFEDPYENAEAIYDDLDRLSSEYSECFQIKISKTGQITQEEGVSYSKIPDKCKSNNEELIRYRFWIADTVTASALACYEGIDENKCSDLGFSNQPNTQAASATTNPNIYVLGDSLTVGMRQAGLEDKLKTAGWENVTISALCGRKLKADLARSCDSPPVSPNPGGLQEVLQDDDQTAIKAAGTVVIGLGTNDAGDSGFKENVEAMVERIRTANSNANIYWVNLFSTHEYGPQYPAMNDTLNELSTANNFKIIDWAKEGPPSYDNGNIHPRNYQAMSDFIAKSVGAPATVTTAAEATGDARSLATQIIDSGKVTGNDRYMNQLKAVAAGDNSCNVNPKILSLIATIAQKHSIYITSLNRKCTNVLTASGVGSYHYRDGGGHAVDIGTVDGVKSTGGSSKDIELINSIMPLLKPGSGIGQVNCRNSGNKLKLPEGVREFNDTCNHIHIQVPVQ
jgi:hypothetical protein